MHHKPDNIKSLKKEKKKKKDDTTYACQKLSRTRRRILRSPFEDFISHNTKIAALKSGDIFSAACYLD